MNATFTIKPNGKMDPSFEATYPAVAYMSPFLDCVKTAFSKLTFRPPPDGQAVHVNALIHVGSPPN
jgi:hypothetical protein